MESGAAEVDLVLPLGPAKSGDWSYVEADIRAVVDVVGGATVKVILETAALEPVQIVAGCLAAVRAGAAFVMTSTGFHASGGATVEAVTLMRHAVGPAFGVKASGGVRTGELALRMLAAGANRIGSSAAAALGSLTAHRFCYGISTVMAVILYRFYFTHNPEAGLTQLTGVLGTSGAGYFAAAFVTPWATDRFRIETWVTMMLVAAGGLELALCVSFQQWGFLAGGFVLGVTGQSVKICTDTVVQRDVADTYLGRVFSIYDMLFNVAFVAAAAVSALFLPANGRSYLALGIVTAGYLVSAVVYRLVTSVPDDSSSGRPLPAAP